MERLSAIEVLEAMVAMFASGDPSQAATVVAEDYLVDHRGNHIDVILWRHATTTVETAKR